MTTVAEPTLEEALQKLKERAKTMTPEDWRQQKISFIVGMIGGDDPAAAREYVEEHFRKKEESGRDTL